MKLFILSLLFIGFTQLSFSQNKLRIVGEAKFLPGELIDQSIRDINGDIAAGIRIKTDLKGLAFEARNGVVKLNTKPGEYFLFVQPSERVIRVMVSEYIPLDIYLNSIGILLKSGQTWEITVSGDKEIPEDLSAIVAIKKQQDADKLRREDEERRIRSLALEKQSEILEAEKQKIREEDALRQEEEQKKADAQARYDAENSKSKAPITNLTLNQTLAKWSELNSKGKKRQNELEELQAKAIKLAVNESPKDEFESQSEYENRLKSNASKRSVIESEYEELISNAWAPIKEEMTELSKLQFAPSTLEINLGSYDAEQKSFPTIAIKATIEKDIVVNNKTTKKAEVLNYLSSAKMEPSVARLFRQSEKILIHNIYLYVDLDGKQKLNQNVEVKEPLENIKVNLKLREGIINSISMIFELIPEQSFYMGKYEVTQKEWKAIMGNNPSSFKGDNLPVENVSWKDVQEFIKKLNQKEDGNKYRLPTEVEWEYAARAGTSTNWSFGDDENKLKEYAWYDQNSNSQTHPVGQKKPNGFGLYDVHGNVWEWVQDSDGSRRVGRGGSWFDGAGSARSAFRMSNGPDGRLSDIGFRLVRLQ